MSNTEVHIELNGVMHRVGTLRVHARSGGAGATFEYHPAWLDFPGGFSLEPSLAIGEGVYAPDKGRDMFVSIGDSAPDTWGRRLMQRMERRTATREGRAVRTLSEVDYLLGVSDVARLGALRFRRDGDLDFKAELRKGMSVPPFIELPKLLAVTQRVLRNEETDDDMLLLFAPGSSLGGARPKSSVADKDGHLAIAKFPKDDDDYSIETWEEVALRLAAMAGITTAEHRIEKVGGRSIILSRRFDRTSAGHRVPFLSAMAMLGMRDGERGSYVELVDALVRNGADTAGDVAELYRRMVFNVLASNVDDHMRNHGFLWNGEMGWKLSPAYDLNPVPADVKAHVLSTNINFDDGTCSVDLVREAAEYFMLSLPDADAIIGEVASACSQWRTVATAVGAKSTEIQRMQTAFDHPELEAALSLSPGRGASSAKRGRRT